MFVRSLIFNFLVYFFLVIFLTGCLPLLLLNKKYTMGVFKISTKFILFCMNIILKIKCEFSGLENLQNMLDKKRGFIIASKHQSMWETFIFSLFIPDLTIVLKEELMRIPIFGYYLKKLNSISIKRSDGSAAIKKIIEKSKKVFENNGALLIFPEGTRTKPGERKKYNIGIAFVYEAFNLEILPVAHNSGKCWGRKTFIKKSGTIKLEFLPIIEAGLNKKEVIERIENSIEEKMKKI